MTTEPFTEAARAEAEERYEFVSDMTCFEDGAEWARAHLAEQEPNPLLPDESEMEVVGEWLVVRNVQEPEYPAGPEYGPYPYSDAAPLVHLAQVAGFPPEPPEPTDAEVGHAHAEWVNHGPIRDLDTRRLNCTCGERGFTPVGYEHHRLRAALSAARAARRDEEKR